MNPISDIDLAWAGLGLRPDDTINRDQWRTMLRQIDPAVSDSEADASFVLCEGTHGNNDGVLTKAEFTSCATKFMDAQEDTYAGGGALIGRRRRRRSRRTRNTGSGWPFVVGLVILIGAIALLIWLTTKQI